MKNSLKNGFTLVELMLTIAIIGILSAIAIPNVLLYAAKAKQAEVKILLSALYTAEKNFHAEYMAYDPRIIMIGFSPEGALRYNVGFGNQGDTATDASGFVAPAGASTLRTSLDYCKTITSGGKKGGGGGAPTTTEAPCWTLLGANGLLPDTITKIADANSVVNNSTSSFLATGTASIAPNSQSDIWTMNQNKEFINRQNGLAPGSM